MKLSVPNLFVRMEILSALEKIGRDVNPTMIAQVLINVSLFTKFVVLLLNPSALNLSVLEIVPAAFVDIGIMLLLVSARCSNILDVKVRLYIVLHTIQFSKLELFRIKFHNDNVYR